MDFEELKRLLKEAVDEAKTREDIFPIWIEKIYRKGREDAQTDSDPYGGNYGRTKRKSRRSTESNKH